MSKPYRPKYIDYDKELADYLNISVEEVKKLRPKHQFNEVWEKENPSNEREAAKAYGSSMQMLRQCRYRIRRMVLYRRVVKELLTYPGKYNEFHGKLFAPYTLHKVLDHGAGSGDIGLALAQLGYEVDLTEIANSELEDFIKWRFERRYLPYRFFGHDEKLPTDYYDVIISVEVLEHVWGLEETLNNLYQSLRKGGLLFLIYEAEERQLYPELPQDLTPIDTFLSKFSKIRDFLYLKT